MQFGVISTCKFFKGNFIVFEKFTRIYQRGVLRLIRNRKTVEKKTYKNRKTEKNSIRTENLM